MWSFLKKDNSASTQELNALDVLLNPEVDSTTSDDIESGDGEKITEGGLDFEEIEVEYSPKKIRNKRSIIDRRSHVHTTSEVVGGDWIYCKESGSRMTISFFFEGPDRKIYGMTCGHIAGPYFPIGMSLFVNQANEYRTFWRCCKPVKEIGKIVNSDVNTDTCIFSVNEDVKVKLNTVRISPKHLHKFNPDTVETLSTADKLAMFGAQGRGMVGEVLGVAKAVVRREKATRACVLVGDLVMKAKFATPQVQHTHDGDCGGLSISEAGNGISIHHSLGTKPSPTWYETCVERSVSRVLGNPFSLKERTYVSYSTLLAPALKAHRCFLSNKMENGELFMDEHLSEYDSGLTSQCVTPREFARGGPFRIECGNVQYSNGGARDPSLINMVLFGDEF